MQDKEEGEEEEAKEDGGEQKKKERMGTRNLDDLKDTTQLSVHVKLNLYNIALN